MNEVSKNQNEKYIKPSCQNHIDSKLIGLDNLYKLVIIEKTFTSEIFNKNINSLFKGLELCLNISNLNNQQ